MKKQLRPYQKDPELQLFELIKAVFTCWDSPDADEFRKTNDIPYSMGTAVVVQRMVFGNLDKNCGTGIVFTRHPGTGENVLLGEFLMNAKGESVIAGTRIPQPVIDLKEMMPEVYEELTSSCKMLEKIYGDMQDVEFTIEDRKFYLLCNHTAKRTIKAAVKAAGDLADEGIITEEEAVVKIGYENLEFLCEQEEDEELRNLSEKIMKWARKYRRDE